MVPDFNPTFTIEPGKKIAKVIHELIPQTRGVNGGFVYVRTANKVPLYGIEGVRGRRAREFTRYLGSREVACEPASGGKFVTRSTAGARPLEVRSDGSER